jgi:hypothetical protein
MVQEAYDTHPSIRAACDAGISDHAAALEADIAEAMEQSAIDADWSAASLALYTQAVIQGAFILAKAKHGPQVASDCLDHLRRYLQLLFTRKRRVGKGCARKLARSAGGSPAQVGPSKPPGNECCASPAVTPAAKRTQWLRGVCD